MNGIAACIDSRMISWSPISMRTFDGSDQFAVVRLRAMATGAAFTDGEERLHAEEEWFTAIHEGIKICRKNYEKGDLYLDWRRIKWSVWYPNDERYVFSICSTSYWLIHITQVNRNLIRYGAVYYSFRMRYVENTPVYEENVDSKDEV